MNTWLSKEIYGLVQKFQSENTHIAMEELSRTQYDSGYSREVQWQNLKNIIEFSYENVDYYRKLFKDAGINPADIKSYKDILAIPLLTKEIIRNNFNSLHEKSYMKKKFTRISSSGSTGEPCIVDLENLCLGYHHAAQFRGFAWYGIEPGDKGIKIWGVPFRFKERLIEDTKDFVLNRYRSSAFEMSEGKLMALYKKCLRWKPKYIYGYASAVSYFAKFIKDNKLNTEEMGIKVIFTTSEIFYPYQRLLIESVFQCPVANEYGSAEAGIIAFECPYHNLHITTENVYLEVLDNGVPAEAGGHGEAIVTNLRNRIMPLIRYRLNDIVTIENVSCECGKKLPILSSIEGRSNDVLITPKGTMLHGEFFSYLNRSLQAQRIRIKEFKIIQKSHDKLLVFVSSTDNNASKAFVSFLQNQIYQVLNEKVNIEFNYVDYIAPEKSGKKRYFVSEIKS